MNLRARLPLRPRHPPITTVKELAVAPVEEVRPLNHKIRPQGQGRQQQKKQGEEEEEYEEEEEEEQREERRKKAVSYTHLTLPTILLV